jgi:hypothetical protein
VILALVVADPASLEFRAMRDRIAFVRIAFVTAPPCRQRIEVEDRDHAAQIC